MSMENFTASHEKPKALSLERVDASSVSISLSEKFKEMSEEDLIGQLLVIKDVFEIFLQKNTEILFEVIANTEGANIEIRPLNQDVEISNKLFYAISAEVDGINAVL